MDDVVISGPAGPALRDDILSYIISTVMMSIPSTRWRYTDMAFLSKSESSHAVGQAT